MITTAIMTAMTMTGTYVVIPTAVMTESTEKTRSSMSIWPITAAMVGATLADVCPSSPSSLW